MGQDEAFYNCYMNSSDDNDKFLESDGNFTGTKAQAFPFEDKTYESGKEGNFRFRNARLTNNFRLNEKDGLTGNRCLNGGSTDVRSRSQTSGNRYGLYRPYQRLPDRYRCLRGR